MKKSTNSRKIFKALFPIGLLLFLVACSPDSDNVYEEGMGDNINGSGSLDNDQNDDSNSDALDNIDTAVFLFIDEDSVDNGNEPNNFSETDVNDDLADIGLRQQLRYFEQNVGKTIDLYTGQVGDEGWHAPKTIPNSWINTGPTDNGLQNYLFPGPGLGGGEDDREVLLDEIRKVIPLRATGLAMLKGQIVYAVVYDSDISTNYDPINANLQGENLGIVSFEVIQVQARNDGSDSDLPKVTVKILNTDSINEASLFLFENSPEPTSSSDPEDTTPPSDCPEIALKKAE